MSILPSRAISSSTAEIRRRRLVEMLEDDQIRISRTHSFTPHITLAYVPAGEPTPMIPPGFRELNFDSLALSWGERTIRFPLQGEVVNTSEENTMENQNTPTQHSSHLPNHPAQFV